MAKPQKAEKYSVDRMMSNVALSLLRDFQTNLNDPCFCSDLQLAIRAGDIARIRTSCPEPTADMGVAEFKASYQLKSVLKRYRYQTDIYSDQELSNMAIAKFTETQCRIEGTNLDELPANVQLILNLASIYIADCLGVYSDEEHRHLCKFGKRATVGVPARAATEAARWELPISGSIEQIAWFDSEMGQIQCVQDYWANQRSSDLDKRSTYQVTSSLRLTLVPKTFKSLRAIMPNTTIGSYMSYGLGEIMRLRLKDKGFDIRSLQTRHRILASRGSVTGKLVTADLSSASDSISVALVERLFPSDWVKILHQSRIRTVDLPNGQSVESLTFCTMGIGYTFPLQTLVFLSLLKAIEQTMFRRSDRRTISVYGDDMIYHTRMHKEVVAVFESLGFVINIDKTFHEGHFRESCGGDYYHGVDVRPFQPQSGPASVSKTAYEAILYKYINTLLVRWSEYEIEKTLLYLCSELEEVTGSVKLVPLDFPDDAGVKCPTLSHWVFLQYVRRAMPKHVGHGVYRFSFLRLVPDEREEKRHDPYLWLLSLTTVRQFLTTLDKVVMWVLKVIPKK
jgi:hypothetical protein